MLIIHNHIIFPHYKTQHMCQCLETWKWVHLWSAPNLTDLERICREGQKIPNSRCAKLVTSYPRRLQAVITTNEKMLDHLSSTEEELWYFGALWWWSSMTFEHCKRSLTEKAITIWYRNATPCGRHLNGATFILQDKALLHIFRTNSILIQSRTRYISPLS